MRKQKSIIQICFGLILQDLVIERTSLGRSKTRLGFAWPHNEIIASGTRKFLSYYYFLRWM